jgi:hypothetical protein
MTNFGPTSIVQGLPSLIVQGLPSMYGEAGLRGLYGSRAQSEPPESRSGGVPARGTGCVLNCGLHPAAGGFHPSAWVNIGAALRHTAGPSVPYRAHPGRFAQPARPPCRPTPLRSWRPRHVATARTETRLASCPYERHPGLQPAPGQTTDMGVTQLTAFAHYVHMGMGNLGNEGGAKNPLHLVHKSYQLRNSYVIDVS